MLECLYATSYQNDLYINQMNGYILFYHGSYSIKLDKKSKSKAWLANISLVKQNHHEHMFWFYRHSFQLNFRNI